MYDFHYKHVKSTQGGNAELLFTDTDSLCYNIFTNDLYTDLEKVKHHIDFSDYPSDHFLYDNTNKKVLGKMKDETMSEPMTEFLGLRPKMYSFTYGPNEKRTTKGDQIEITPCIVQRMFMSKKISQGNHDYISIGKTSDTLYCFK